MAWPLSTPGPCQSSPALRIIIIESSPSKAARTCGTPAPPLQHSHKLPVFVCLKICFTSCFAATLTLSPSLTRRGPHRQTTTALAAPRRPTPSPRVAANEHFQTPAKPHISRIPRPIDPAASRLLFCASLAPLAQLQGVVLFPRPRAPVRCRHRETRIRNETNKHLLSPCRRQGCKF